MMRRSLICDFVGDEGSEKDSSSEFSAWYCDASLPVLRNL